jgi:hypothetical protein
MFILTPSADAEAAKVPASIAAQVMVLITFLIFILP